MLFNVLLIKIQSRLESRGVLPKMAYTERLHPKGVPFSGFKYMRGLRFHLLKYMKGLGKLPFRLVKKAHKGLTDALHPCGKSWVIGLVLWFIHILKTVHLQQLRGMPCSKPGMWKRYHCLQKVKEGVPFLSKMVYKRVKGWPPGGASLYKTLLRTPRTSGLRWIPKDALLLYRTRWNYC